MKVKVKIQDKQQKYIKNGGMQLLNNYIKMHEAQEIELKKDEEYILDSPEFKHWFEVVQDKPVQDKPAEKKKSRLRLKKDED